MSEKFLFAGKQCTIIENGSNGPIFLWPMFPHRGNEIEHMQECLQEVLPDKSYVVAAFQVDDWNADLSPWEAQMMYRDSGFAGHGPDTLRWMTQEYVPFLRERYGEGSGFIPMGYSLAGLFALWSAYETDLFAGVIACSSSLWFEKWDCFVQTNTIKSKAYVYLSLGGKEEKVKDPVVATVGMRHREQEKLLKADENVEGVVFELNSGGHFADSAKRMVKGISWMLNR